ncbi:MAG: chemotaxis-specific protein-glutamate methyltransferase CheB [Pirellulales bacterium]
MLVVAADALCRKLIADALRSISGVEVVGMAADEAIALEKLRQGQPDVVVLDVAEAGLDTLHRIRNLQPDTEVVGLCGNGGVVARVLEYGARVCIPFPGGRASPEQCRELKSSLSEALAGAVARQQVRRAPRRSQSQEECGSRIATLRPEIVVIGVSTGGPEALSEVLPQLPADLAAPVLVVQHMPPVFTRSLADDLNGRCKLRVLEGVHGQRLSAGEILIAPGGRHMRIDKSAAGLVATLTDDPPENSCRPSVDYLFRSVAEVLGSKALAVIMTGMGCDGAAGCRLLHREGAAIIAQNAATCVIFGMPQLPIAEGLAEVVAPLKEIAGHIINRVGHRTCLSA